MTFLDHEDGFAGLPIREYDPDERIEDAAAVAYRLGEEWDAPDDATILAKLDRFLADPGSRRATALVIGAWGHGSEPAGPILSALAAAGPRLPALRALFVGDITPEECELSWIGLSDLDPLLAAYPALEYLRARGGDALEFDCDRHDGLRTLILESSGLPILAVRQVGVAELPRLEHLELWLGGAEYVEGAEPIDLAPIFAGDRLPALRSLGLRNSAMADEMAVALADSAILGRIEALDLSLGTLGDEGAIALLESGRLSGLKRLDIRHHYLSDEVLDGLIATGIELAHDGGQGDDAEDRSVAVRYESVTE